MGPLALFDKSFLQSLNANEAPLFDVLFRTNITPLFYMETLADLQKDNGRRTPENEVRIIASKTPTWAGNVNASHVTMCAGELMGHNVPMKQMPVLPGGNDDNGLIAQLYDAYFPHWRTRQIEVPVEAINNNPEQHAKILKQVKAMEDAAKRTTRRPEWAHDYDNKNLDMLTIERRVSKHRGDWLFLPADLQVDE